jgi:surface carbohydrate biosynthesis protein (TIGR04326 family)
VDVSRAGWSRYRLFYECSHRYLNRVRPALVVFPFEGQPWEKLLVQATRDAGAVSVGVQHSTIGPNYLSYFPGRRDVERGAAAWPDAIIAAGRYPWSLFHDSGLPQDRLLPAGSMRYRHLASLEGRPALEEAPAATVLVALPIDRPTAEHLVLALASAFPDGGLADGLAFQVRAHPNTPVDVATFGLAASVSGGTFEQALRQCGTVIYAGSTTGPEAAAYGRRVLRYVSPWLVDVDVSGPFSQVIPSASDDHLREAVLTVVRQPAPRFDPGLLGELFGVPDEPGLQAWFAERLGSRSRKVGDV